jgi:hypothetical protein
LADEWLLLVTQCVEAKTGKQMDVWDDSSTFDTIPTIERNIRKRLVVQTTNVSLQTYANIMCFFLEGRNHNLVFLFLSEKLIHIS